VGLWHHEHHEDGVGGADARKVDEEAPGAQQGHHSCCHLYRNEYAAKLDGHQCSGNEALQLRREPLSHEDPGKSNDGDSSGKHEDKYEDHHCPRCQDVRDNSCLSQLDKSTNLIFEG